MKKVKVIVILILLCIIVYVITLNTCVYQKPDMNTDLSVEKPTFSIANSPKVLFDAGHGNFHGINNTYKPFTKLLENDGIVVNEINSHFTETSLDDVDLIIIANATETILEKDNTMVTFTDVEIQVLRDWIQKGGSLLLIADHDPFGSASSKLAKEFGVGMSSVWTVDTLRINDDIGKYTWLEYTQENDGLGQHEILEGHSSRKEIEKIITFTGQSLSFDSTWTPILKLSGSAQDYYNRADASISNADPVTFFPVPNHAQLIARKFGEGKIVISGEAAMFTAQKVRIFLKTSRAGFNYPGYDNKNLLLNTIHWLLSEQD